MTESKFGMKNAGQPTEQSSSRHIPVLLHEAIEGLNLKDGDIFLDGTLGSAGHSLLVAEKFGDDVEIIGIDRDADALRRSEERLRALTHSAYFRLESFRNLDQVLVGLGIKEINAILLDLGISSEQLNPPAGGSGRGFSFQRDEPLDMRMSSKGITAAEILNSWDEHAIELILRGFGEERHSRTIAKKIVERRLTKPFKTTNDLLEVVGKRTGKIHPATKTFQALRIAVNEELDALEDGLKKAFHALGSKGRLAVISFHSLEDRIVKNFMRDRAKEGKALLITKKPITPSEEEVRRNPRSRSAKLRILEKKEVNEEKI